MSSTIKLEIENTPQNALAASAFFALLSGDESAKALAAKAKGTTVGPKTEAPDPAPIVEQAEQPEPEVVEQTQPEPEQTAAANADGVPPTVDLSIGLDDEGLPWDSRIHSTGKKKLAKKPHTWKLIRGVDKDLVAKVQAELSAIDWSDNGGSNEQQQPANTDAAAAFGFPSQQAEAPADLDQAKLVQLCMDAMGRGHQFNGQPMQQHHVLEMLAKHGVQNPTQVAANPAGAMAALKELGVVG